MEVKTLAPGSSVGIKGQMIDGIIHAVAIDINNTIRYEVIWWTNGIRAGCWLYPHEIDVLDKAPKYITIQPSL